MKTKPQIPIAVVGMGCLLPEASSPDSFWKNILNGHCSIRALPETRWKKEYVQDSKDHPDRVYSRMAAYIEDAEILRLAKEHRLNVDSCNRLQVMGMEASAQALSQISPVLRKSYKWLVTFGCMGQDEEVWKTRFVTRVERFLSEKGDLLPAEDREKVANFILGLRKSIQHPFEDLFPTSVLSLIQEKLGVEGHSYLIDSACASSLAAIDTAMNELSLGKVDFALTGGLEDQLGPESFATFCSAGLLAPETCLPLDNRSLGVSQGEGAVAFTLCRLETALKFQLPVIALIRSSEGSSNGKAASLFSPTLQGQTTVLEGAYQNLKTSKLVYVECHATGTTVGDRTELQALDGFFSEQKEKLSIGSVKSLIGHTKGTAGAAGLLKCLLALKHRTIPPSTYFQNFVGGLSPTHLRIPTQKEPFPEKGGNRLLGVSAAGFGGSNYHLVIEEFSPSESRSKIQVEKPNEEPPVVCIGESLFPVQGSRKYFSKYPFKILPKSLPFIDELQLAAPMAVEEALQNSGIEPAQLQKARVVVVSASSTGLESTIALSNRLRCREMDSLNLSNEARAILMELKESFPEIVEDTGPSVLNNVIAGRISNLFNFLGKNFNVDADVYSPEAAIRIADQELRLQRADLVIVVGIREVLQSDRWRVERTHIQTYLMTTKLNAEKWGIEPKSELKEVLYKNVA